MSPQDAELGGALDWRAGRITAKKPSHLLLAKMCRLAKVLDTRVQGDDGETTTRNAYFLREMIRGCVDS